MDPTQQLIRAQSQQLIPLSILWKLLWIFGECCYDAADSLLFVRVQTMRRYESWLQILLKDKRIFSVKLRNFLDLNQLHHDKHRDSNLGMEGKPNAVKFRLKALHEQNEYNLSANYASKEHDEEDMTNKLVNTLTSTSIFNNYSQKEDALNVQSCILWLYNAKNKKVSIIDDNELDKICKRFSKYIVLSATKNRKKTMSTPVKPKPFVHKRMSELTTMFARGGGDGDANTEPNGNRGNLRRHVQFVLICPC